MQEEGGPEGPGHDTAKAGDERKHKNNQRTLNLGSYIRSYVERNVEGMFNPQKSF